MADSTTHLVQLQASQAQKEVTQNGLNDAASPAMSYGRRAEACSGLYWGYYGTRYGGVLKANGTHLCEPDEVIYMTVELATGDVAFATESSSSSVDMTWYDPAYGRAYRLTTNANSITSYEDHRFGPYGIANGLGAVEAYAPIFGSDAGGSFQSGGIGTSGQVLTSNGAGAIATFQAIPSELALLGGSNDDILQRKSGAWTYRTIAQVSADLQGSGLTADAVGFRTIPQNSQSGAYTAVAADAGKHLLHPSADTTARTFTIPANSSVAYPVGTAITFVNQASAGVMTIAITTDTMRLAGAGTTGSRTLAANGVATALKITSTEWIISGTGLT